MSTFKAHVKTVDMSEEMEADAISIATEAIMTCSVEKDMAAYIKREFDKKHSPTWHVIIGTNYGSHVVHATKCGGCPEVRLALPSSLCKAASA